MLSNIVGTLLAFVTIMLMLSLIVTSLVQFTQATLRLRARNLLVGVAALIEHHAPQARSAEPTSPLRSNPQLVVAAHVLNNADASLKYLAAPNAVGRVLLGPPVSWIKSGDLAQAVVGTLPAMADASAATRSSGAAPAAGGVAGALPPPVSPASGVSAAAVQQTFENIEPAMSKRFLFIIRIWTVAWSFALVFVFQLSTPALLKQLPAAEAKREAILAAVPSLTTETNRKLAFSTDNVLEESVERLTKDFPEYKELFEELSGESDSKQSMMEEMRSVLGSRPNREAVLADYSSIIDSFSQSAASAAYANSSQLIEKLDSFGISPKLNNFDFYMSTGGVSATNPNGRRRIHWTNIVGVIITGILLSLGAPFWFEQLKNLSSLRDAMNPSAAKAKAS
jgi:hypothetical protein